MSHPGRWFCCLALFACAESGDSEHPRYFTEHLEVELFDGEMICAGTLAAMDGQVERVAGLLAIAAPERVAVHYGPSAAVANCEGRGGCTRASGVYADSGSIFHELVHAVRHSQGDGPVGTLLFEEGFAEVMSGYRWQVQYVLAQTGTVERGPAVLATWVRGQDQFEAEDYATAAHFMSWLRTGYGDPRLVDFLNDARYLDGEHYAAAFADHFGLSIEAADSLWRESAATEYVWSDVCDPSLALRWEEMSLRFSDTVDCEAPHTTGPSGYLDSATLRSHCFSLAEPQTLRVQFISEGGRLRVMPVDCVDDDGLAPEFRTYKSMMGGETQVLPFAACAWEVEVDGSAGVPHDFTLRLSPF